MEETKAKPKYTQEQLNVMDFKHLRQACIELGISPVSKNLKQLRMALGAAPKNATVLDRSEGMSREELEDRRNRNKRILGKTIYFDKDDPDFWKVLEKNPDAFDNVDFTDATAKAQHVFSPNIKCIRCKTKFKMQREYEKKKDGKKVMVVHKEKDGKSYVDIKACPSCGIIYYYHNTNEDWEIYAE